MRYLFSLVSLFCILLIANPVLAQSAMPITQATASTADSSLADTATFFTRSIALTKFRRLFTRNQVKRGELTAAITTALLKKAQAAQADGDIDKTNKALNQYAKEIQTLETIVTTIQANTADNSVQLFLEGVAADQARILALLQDSDKSEKGEVATKFVEIQAQALKSIVRILEKDMPAAEREKKLTQVMAKYNRKLTNVEEKMAKLNLLDDIDAETENEELETELENESEDVVRDAADELDDSELKSLAEKMDDNENGQTFVRLELLLANVPESAKTGIETAIDVAIADKLKRFNDDPTLLEAFAATLSGSAADKEKVLERIKEKSSPALKQSIEKEKTKVERQRESDKKTLESKRESEKQRSEKATEGTKSESSAVPQTTATPETQSSTIEIKVEDGKLEQSSFLVRKNSKLTIKFKNEDDTVRAVRVSSGLTSPSVANGEVSQYIGVITDTLAFTVTGINDSGTITAQ